MKKWLALLLGCTGVAALAYGAEVPQQTVAANEVGLAYSNTYPVDISAARSVSMQVTYTSATIASKTFSDGSQSTGALTVVSFTALSSATATSKIIVKSNAGLANQTLFFAGNNIPIRYDSSASSMTACNMAADIAAATVYLSTCAIGNTVGIVFSTAPAYGSSYNSFSVQSTSLTAISSAPFSGGQDNQSFSINGVSLVANKDWFPATSATATATSIASAIVNSSTTIGARATGSGAIVTATSTLVGVGQNFAMTSSSNAALSLAGTVTVTGSQGTSAMSGGTSSAFASGAATIAIPAHGFTTALPVLLSTGGATITPLVNQTTYYVIVVDANNIKLGTTSALAQAGTATSLTGAAAQTTADTVTLAPLAITGTPGFTWDVSNDKTNWTRLTQNVYGVAVTSVTMSAYTLGGATSIWDLGPVAYNWLRLNVTGPTTGGILVKGFVAGKP